MLAKTKDIAIGLKILHIIILSLPRSLKGSFPSSSPGLRMRAVRALHACSLDLFSCVRMRRIFVICQPASAQLLPSLRRSFLPDNSSGREEEEWGRVILASVRPPSLMGWLKCK